VVLYCRSGARSYHACNFLNQQGIDNVINLRGGIIAWARNGYEIAPRSSARRHDVILAFLSRFEYKNRLFFLNTTTSRSLNRRLPHG
jgi:hypothetical protein